MFSGILLTVSSFELTRRKIIQRSNNYLCFKFLNTNAGNFLNYIAKTNRSIQAVTTFGLIPVLTLPATKIKKGLQLSQYLIYLVFIEKITLAPNCSFRDRLNVINNNPYRRKGGLFLSRLPDGTMALRKNKWEISISNASSPYGLLLPSSLIKGELEIKGRFDPKIPFKSFEKTRVDLSKWKLPFGD